MPLVKQGRVVDDPYVLVGDDAPIDDAGPVVIPAARFLADAAEITRRSGQIGVLWSNDRNVSQLAPYLDKLALVILQFPTFKDGRAYSQARVLRERHHFRGELRATGQVLRDQFLFLHRAGFDAFDVKKTSDVAAFRDAIARYSVFYQPSADGSPAAFRRRREQPASPSSKAKERVS